MPGLLSGRAVYAVSSPRPSGEGEHHGKGSTRALDSTTYPTLTFKRRSRTAIAPGRPISFELEEKHRFLRAGKVVLDLGAAPGGWSQVAAKKVGSKGTVLALDRLAMDPIEGVTILEVDFETEEGYAALRAALPEAGADVVLSDMAPNLSGIHAADQDRAIALAELALDLAAQVLVPSGVLVVKLFRVRGSILAGRGSEALYSSDGPEA